MCEWITYFLLIPSISFYMLVKFSSVSPFLFLNPRVYKVMLFIVFQSCQSLEDHLMNNEGNPQPYLLATGTSKAQVFSFYIVLDRKLLPCQSGTSLGAFDELFKCHFVFSVKYEDALSSLYTFLQTTVYNIDVGTTVESPRVKELRAKLLNK